MPYITNIERIVRKEGFDQGVMNGIEQSIRRLLLKGINPAEVARLLDADKKIVIRISKELRKPESKPGMV